MVTRRAGRSLAVATLLVVWLSLASLASAAGPVGSAGSPDSVGQTRHLVMMIVYTCVALGFSFLCSVAEAVVLSISPSFIARHDQDRGKKGMSTLKKIKVNIDRSLAAILTLNTIAHTVGAGGAGAEAAAYFGDEYVGLAMAVLTLLILFLSEIIPKTLGAVYWRSLATPTAYFVQILIYVLFPLIYVSEMLTKLFTKGRSLHGISREEFAAMADIGAEGGQIDRKESRILKNLFRFTDLQANDIMTPRTVVFALQQERTVQDVLDEHAEISFSRIPIYQENRDDIRGFVLKTDLLLNKTQSEGKGKLQDLKRDLGAVLQDTKLSHVLEKMLDNRDHILLVVDEYGGMQGIVTLEDLVETLIGMEIVDEADTDVDMRILAREKWQARMERAGINVHTPGEDAS